jgi:hypothetical protein
MVILVINQIFDSENYYEKTGCYVHGTDPANAFLAVQMQ